MPRSWIPYPAEFWEQIITLARAVRCVESLAREFEPCVATIHGWVKQADARMAIFEFIEARYNPARRHSALGYQSPIADEWRQIERLQSASV
ncbi:hypothetical protein HDIA_3110 [Hartmannibacter diazotrophicus]|uniref:Integrase catalytic domain-containing protein n=1 Tax=Hartmannibacter diazotrophicus TaxID=1482074 RepID=A0A2C9DA83_9HYPH|nr:hypothetical protein [Hartmannibacter diazotrophicus]SON56651.1 hypothetical protein HDIA_3110 [Hartmannibacter diazotrophicus]